MFMRKKKEWGEQKKSYQDIISQRIIKHYATAIKIRDKKGKDFCCIWMILKSGIKIYGLRINDYGTAFVLCE